MKKSKKRKVWVRICWTILEIVSTFSYDLDNWCNKQFDKLEEI